ncbi:hypothetical protein PVL30_005383 [Lodderomyces elongisporus]|uniref:uncharacterized protein n=1 Tax=Lodderomyces elongisporus TaxID=36914 RepID=UPI00291C7B78|nr:uncharacterized protein PVL30_005383 [Lodderomyces elongisporus]WLF81584.1 hypothetical protein PVL30_005383 [Lodderomyces elongisporus]
MDAIDTLLNEHALNYFIAHGFQQLVNEISEELGKISPRTPFQIENIPLIKPSLDCISLIGFEKIFSIELENDRRLANSSSQEALANPSIAVIEDLICGHASENFKFPELSTLKIVQDIENGVETSKREYIRPEIKNKMLSLLLQVADTVPGLKLVDKNNNNGIENENENEGENELNNSSRNSNNFTSKDKKIMNLSLFLAMYLKELKSQHLQSIGAMLDDAAGYLMSGYEGSIPLDLLQSSFKVYLASNLKFISSGSIELQSGNEKIVNELRERANNLMSYSAFAQAIKLYTEAISVIPKPSKKQDVQLYTNRAIAYIGLNCVPEAIDDLNMAVYLDRTFTPAWTQLGYCHMYMGNALLALECYLLSLKSASGDLLPIGFPDDRSLRKKYKSMKIQTILPQFVEKLNSAIALTEKRSYQQRVPEDKIKKIVSEVRKVLAQLRAMCPESDCEYYTYTPVYRDSSLRNLSERINSTRPNILTPEVSQRILASNGMETATITEIDRRHEPIILNTDTMATGGETGVNGIQLDIGLGANGTNTNTNANANTNANTNANANVNTNTNTNNNTNVNGGQTHPFPIRELLNFIGGNAEARAVVNNNTSAGQQQQQQQQQPNDATNSSQSENRTNRGADQQHSPPPPPPPPPPPSNENNFGNTFRTQIHTIQGGAMPEALLQTVRNIIPPGLSETFERALQRSTNTENETRTQGFGNTQGNTQGNTPGTEARRDNSGEEQLRNDDTQEARGNNRNLDPSIEDVPDLD